MICTAFRNSAPNRRYSPASDAITTISDSALLMGWLCTSRFTAPATQITPKNRNKIRWNMFEKLPSGPQRHNQRRVHNVGDCQGQQDLPPKRHELVIAKARQSPAHPDVQEHKKENFQTEPDYRHHCLQNRRTKNRPMPSPKK